MENSYYNIVETILLIFAADEGKLKIYLKKKEDEPYKGYWTLPSAPLNSTTTLEENARIIYKSMTGLDEPIMTQSQTFSDLNRDPENRIIGTTFNIIADKTAIDLKQEAKNKAWFEIDELPKLGFDHATIIKSVSKEIKKQIINNYNDILLNFFQNDFTLPELQSFYENILGKAIDRRNFHKKFVNQDLVIDTGIKTTKGSGRPGALYRFNKEKMKGKRI